MNIYLAGASSELTLVASYMIRVIAAGHSITHNWAAVIRTNGAANPRDASRGQCSAWSAEDIDGILNCEVFWLLCPNTPSIGCWIELGIAIRLTRTVVISGDWRKTIFSSLADRLYDSHDEALAALLAEAA